MYKADAGMSNAHADAFSPYQATNKFKFMSQQNLTTNSKYDKQPPRSNLNRFVMGIFKKFRSKHNLKDNQPSPPRQTGSNYPPVPYYSANPGIDYTYKLTPPILARIFSFVCPHSSDLTFETFEDVDYGDTCFLCDMRDLANCARVKRTWYQPVQQSLYRSVRFDQMHYCELEDILRKTRSKRSGRKARRNDDDDYVYHAEADPALDRLKLFNTSVRNSSYLGSLVQFIKLPSLIREGRKMEIAQLVNTCPHLRYIDLPHTFYEGDKTTEVIRSEMWANCPDIREMKFLPGSGPYLEMLGYENRWAALEKLIVKGIRVDLAIFRDIIATLPYLQTLVLIDLADVNDDLFSTVPGIIPFPQIPSLELHELPKVTTEGILRYLIDHGGNQRLTSLTLENTGVSIPALHQVLTAAHNLLSLTVISDVMSALPLEPLPPLASSTLQTLHYEITSGIADSIGHPNPVGSYHKYLLDSIIEMTLPALRALYVRDQGFPEALLHAGTIRSRNSMAHQRNLSANSARSFSSLNSAQQDQSGGEYNPFHSPGMRQNALSPSRSPVIGVPRPGHQRTLTPPNPTFLQEDPYARHSLVVPQGTPAQRRPAPIPAKRGLRQPLEVFTKSQYDSIGDWLSRPLDPAPPPGASPRPISHFNAEWGAHARRSVMVADGEGGFLAVPGLTLDPAGLSDRPSTSHSLKSFRSASNLRAPSSPWIEDTASQNRRSRFEPGKVGDLW